MEVNKEEDMKILATIVIDNLKWGDVYKNHSVIKFCMGFVIFIIVVRIVKVLVDFINFDIFVHLIKMFVYLTLVFMISYYFYRYPNKMQEISVFTGFTYIFSVIEVADNFSAMFVDILGQGLLNRRFSKKANEREENMFMNIVKILYDLEIDIKPGRVNLRSKNCIRQLDDIYNNTFFYFEKIDNIIKNDNEENASVKDVLMDLWCDNIICRIRRKINDQNVGILDSSIKLNESDCNEVKQKIDRVIELKRKYEKSKSKAVNEKRVLNSVD